MELFEPLSTERLTIRLLAEGDVETFFGYRILPEVFKYQAWKPESVEKLKQFAFENSTLMPFRPGIFTQFAIDRKSDRLLIGDLGVKMDDECQQAEIGYTIAPPYQGSGYAFEAVSTMLTHLFETLSIHRVFGSVDPENGPSIGILLKMGFRKEAHFIKSYRMRGGWYDDCIYGLLREEWEARKDGRD